MSDWPKDVVDLSAFGTFSSAGEGSPLADAAAALASPFNTPAGWPVANLGLFMPVVTRRPMTVYQLGWFNGAAVSGNADVGVYDKNWNRLVSSGSTPQAGVSAVQAVDTADTTLPPGLYYLALAFDNTTGSTYQLNTTSLYLRAAGVAQQAAAFPLPAIVTPAVPSPSFIAPLVFGSIAGAVI